MSLLSYLIHWAKKTHIVVFNVTWAKKTHIIVVLRVTAFKTSYFFEWVKNDPHFGSSSLFFYHRWIKVKLAAFINRTGNKV
jgi:hypothetical protein